MRLVTKSYSLNQALLIAASTVLAVLPLAAKQPPPFGDSISWTTGKEAPSLEGMRGKSVLILFFQSWCGICNGWSPDLFEQLGKAYGNDPKVVLIALKTDGGSMDDALDYMKSRTDPDLWVVGVEENATYYRQATGDDSLYHYMWVKPDGTIGKTDGASYHNGKEPKKFVLANEKTQTAYRKNSKPLMPLSPALDEALMTAVKKAELGLYLGALEEAGKVSSNPSLKEDVATFKSRIAERLESSIERYATAINDEQNQGRYLAYLALTKIEADFGSSAPGKAAARTAMPHANAAWLEDEEEAEKDYQSIMRRAKRADDARSRERIKKALIKLAEEFPNTLYGRIAGSSKGSPSLPRSW